MRTFPRKRQPFPEDFSKRTENFQSGRYAKRRCWHKDLIDLFLTVKL
ncbi:hypothetical protein LEP1GSC108_0097 [Leptospira weilii str. UI 13098]|nr:hypothetical protein LEP1GSC108_0097 [Leptospira weilii str. UI 13098]